jgi:hypothetical protein
MTSSKSQVELTADERAWLPQFIKTHCLYFQYENQLGLYYKLLDLFNYKDGGVRPDDYESVEMRLTYQEEEK